MLSYDEDGNSKRSGDQRRLHLTGRVLWLDSQAFAYCAFLHPEIATRADTAFVYLVLHAQEMVPDGVRSR